MPSLSSPAPAPSAPRRGANVLFFFALLAAVLAAYHPVWRAGFIWDDDGHVTPPPLQSLHGLRLIWFQANATQQYYPVLHSAFWAEHRLWGDAAGAYHVLNLVLHAAAAFLLYRVLYRLALPGARVAAAVFALHPVAVESVAWISEEKNTLSAVFYLAAALAYLRFDRLRRTAPYVLASVLFLLALGSKTVTATLPAALLVILWWRRGRLAWRPDVLPLVPWFLAAGAAGAVTAWMERTYVGATGPAFRLGVADRVLIAGRALWFYLGKLAWPHPLIFIYPRWHIDAGSPAGYVFPTGAALVLAALFALRRRARGPLAAALLFAGTLFPALGFINIFPFIYSFVADHFQYLAAAAALSAATAGVAAAARALPPGPRRWAGGAAGLLLAGLGLLTYRQACAYTDAETLWVTTLERNPGAAMADQNLGGLYLRAGRTERALPLFERAVALQPDNDEARNELGVALLQAGRAPEAEAQFHAALAAAPDNAETHLNLGVVLLQLGRPAESTAEFERALALSPRNVKALKNLAAADGRAGHWDRAAARLATANRIEPNNADTLTSLAGAFLAVGQASDAIKVFQGALAVQPDLTAARYGLAHADFSAGRLQESAAEYRTLLAGAPDDPELHAEFAAVLARAGQWEGSAAQYRQALDAQPGRTGALAGLAAAYLHLRQPAAAGDCYRRALRIEPGSAPFHNGLGITLAQQGATAEAVVEFERALAIDPGFEAARRNLERARDGAAR